MEFGLVLALLKVASYLILSGSWNINRCNYFGSLSITKQESIVYTSSLKEISSSVAWVVWRVFLWTQWLLILVHLLSRNGRIMLDDEAWNTLDWVILQVSIRSWVAIAWLILLLLAATQHRLS